VKMETGALTEASNIQQAKIREQEELPEEEAFMDTFGEVHSVDRLYNSVLLFEKESEIHVIQVHHVQPTLEDIQRRAYRIHHEHGAVTGGYTLDDWLEAEHELLDEIDGSSRENAHLH
jgi:Protein of unknown function (DUF2934)